ncbi:MAG TPA: SMEK domain-containing protein [Candidatus Paceibacterota bacterium]|nr:SMEK domain-containing protein [Candidatus Paceibacterota bacterium]
MESSVKLNNSNGLTDINSYSEDFFCNLLNKILDLNLVNLNVIKLNFPSVDLGDEGKQISIQVTSECTGKKIKDTIKKFDEHSLSSKFKTLRFVIISSKKPSSKAKIVSPKDVAFDPSTDILCLTDLIALIRPFSVPEIQEIVSVLKKELDSQKGRKSEPVLASEVETIADLVVFLSDNKELSEKTWTEEPDPQKKIEHRFASEAPFLKSQIIDLLPRYSLARNEVDEKLGLDSVKVKFIRDFLRTKSDVMLTQTDGDPKKALDNLTEHLACEIGKNGKKHDYQAIRFYVLDELIKCNVFPN